MDAVGTPCVFHGRNYISILLALSLSVSFTSFPVDGALIGSMQLEGLQAFNIWQLFVNRNVALQYDIRQDDQTEAVLLSIYEKASPLLLFHLSTSTVTNSIHVQMRAKDNRLRRYSVHAPLNDGEFHKIILTINGNELRVTENCHELLRTNDDSMDFRQQTIQAYIGQDREGQGLLQGRMREFTADAESPIELKCPDLELIMDNAITKDFLPLATSMESSTDIISYSRHSKVSEDRLVANNDEMDQRVGYLENQFRHWSSVVRDLENRVQQVELHQRGCQVAGRSLSFGEKQQNLLNCSECQCSSSGVLHCGPIGCPHLTCEHPIQRHGRCCPECGKSCYYNGNHYENGATFWPKPCVHCVCHEGKMECQYKRADSCPILECPEQEIPPNECCARCVNIDHCSSNPCHENAECQSERHSAKCTCKTGYFGNGTICYDIDECLWDDNAREQLGGCGMGTVCINRPGSFLCDCSPGFRRLDAKNCLDVIRV